MCIATPSFQNQTIFWNDLDCLKAYAKLLEKEPFISRKGLKKSCDEMFMQTFQKITANKKQSQKYLRDFVSSIRAPLKKEFSAVDLIAKKILEALENSIDRCYNLSIGINDPYLLLDPYNALVDSIKNIDQQDSASGISEKDRIWIGKSLGEFLSHFLGPLNVLIQGEKKDSSKKQIEHFAKVFPYYKKSFASSKIERLFLECFNEGFKKSPIQYDIEEKRGKYSLFFPKKTEKKT